MVLLDHTCTVSRNASVGTNGRRQLQQLAAGVPCLVLPMNNQTTIENNFSLGRAYDVYFDATADVKAGDKLTWNGSSLLVRAVQSYQLALVGHLRALCEMEVS